VAQRSARLHAKVARKLYERANAERWGVDEARLTAVLETGVAKAFSDQQPDARELDRFLSSLHLEDLALACGCADGNEAAWEHFVLAHRPILYRSADALEPGGGAREIADALYAELFGLRERAGERQSLFRYFHGRSSLATWLRAVLSQRFIDRVRAHRRLESLPENDEVAPPTFTATPPDPDRSKYLALMGAALAAAIGRLPDRDRLRMSLYYAQQLTLAQAGRILHEHEATVSRQLARTRGVIKAEVERQLREDSGLNEAEVTRCFDCVMQDTGPMDLGVLFRNAEPCKPGEPDRSM
jgi:RNA polymerase sigma factor (sigma-70 family)